ncbi:coiled-coil domain-containing protein 14 [Nycticebus coucang]|uniref:coiled-coil domain-containing protein 14 n=1 Tax=Nycticebus coucang TaxID=9470 RepID=UPI00234DCA55|nr:coiled-coil domain-containing protein 14 [Nycticebus coucang]
MKRGVRRASFRKRKARGRAKKPQEPKAVDSYYCAAALPWVWASLKLREMVKSGCRPGQVLSSGTHAGSTKLTNGKKGTHLRKITRFNADSGHSTNSDSASQTETAQGLDGCASLLRDILRNEDSGSEIVCSENKSNPRPLEGKRYGYKKKGYEKHTFPLGAQKEMTSSRNKKKIIANETYAGSGKHTSDLPQNWSLQDHYRMYSPMVYQALQDHVQTQMSLMKNLASENKMSGISAVPGHSGSGSESQAASDSNYGSYTSRSVWSPQQPPCPQVVHSEVQTDGDNQFSSQTKTVPVNSSDCLKNLFNTIPGVPCSLPQTDISAIPTFQPVDLGNRILPQQGIRKEADLLKCFQTYMSLFQSHGKETHSNIQIHRSPIPSQPAFGATNEEKCAKEQIREAASEEKDLNIGMQDASIIKDVKKAKNVNHTAEKVRTLKYLLRELKALVAEQEDSEIHRLVTEVEACVSVLPAVNGITDIQLEIALAMQPLRSENAQLRRQLRSLNQQLREQEKTHKVSGTMECNLELFSLQSLNLLLQNQLQESLKSQELLQSKNEELLKVIENQKNESIQFSNMFKDKEQIILENKQQFDIEMTKIKIELEEALVNMKSSQFKLETAKKENQILGITLRQHDAELTRLRELTRTLQNSMAKLLSDLSVDSARCKPRNNLTKSLLNIYDRQLQDDPIPAHASIMSYLNKLERSHTFTHSQPLSTVKTEETLEPDRLYEDTVPSRSPQHGLTRPVEEESTARVTSPLPKEDSDEGSETMTLTENEHNLGNTIYIPFARSTPKKKSPLSTRISPQPQINVATTQLTNSSAFVSGKENELCAPVVGSSSTKETEDELEELPRTADVKDKQLLKKIKEVIGKIPAASKDPGEQAACHGLSACHSSSIQAKGNTNGSALNSDLMSDWSVSSFSTFTSRDEQDFRNGLAALDANIARLQKSLRTGLLEK